jgi:SAM-dependent methyltransferase
MDECFYCRNDDFSVIADKEQMRFGCYGLEKKILKCLRCGLVQLLPRWTDDELKMLYAKYSQKSDFPGARPKQTISSYLTKYLKKSDSILEVGCSFGDNLKRLKKKGYKIIGIDKDPTVCDGKDILNHDYKDFPLQKDRFDGIYAIQVFEHISDPYGFIEWLYASLKEKSRFLLELPNIDDPLLELYKVDNFRKFYWYPYHLFFYDRKTLNNIFKKFPKIKIKVRLLQRYGLINHLRWLMFKRPGNFNRNIPVLDDIYKFVITRVFKVSDTLLVIGEKNE